MLSILLTTLALSGFSSAASSSAAASTATGPTTTSTEISFAFPGGNTGLYVPTAGVSGKVWNVTSSTTTVIFHCPSDTAKSSGNGTEGALCATDGDGPVKVEFADDYWSMGFYQSIGTREFAPQTTLAEPVTVGYEEHCKITASKTTNSPVCTVNFTSIPSAVKTADVVAMDRCFEEDVAGPASEVQQGAYNTISVGACQSSLSANPTTAYTVTRNPDYVRYWTVTVTEVAAGVTLEPSSGASASMGVAGVLEQEVITPEQEEVLRSKKPIKGFKNTREGRWEAIYSLLFPNEEIPSSPYVPTENDEPVETSDNGLWDFKTGRNLPGEPEDGHIGPPDPQEAITDLSEISRALGLDD
ncbi:hypothetical protein SLS54_010521 [Diplodia seriata]